MREAVANSTTQDFVDNCVSRCIDEAVEYFREEAGNRAEENADVSAAESPLEEAFTRCWEVAGCLGEYTIRLRPQVVASGYRLDFALACHVKGFPKIAIELDGHEFHEKTKEQATYRNERDRALQMAGWQVLHVSGSEFYRNPFGCVHEIYTHAVEEARVCDYLESLRRA